MKQSSITNAQRDSIINCCALRDEIDRQILNKTNDERRANGLKPFAPHTKLHQMAVKHSEQMLQHHFFSHENPFNPELRHLVDRLNNVKDDRFAGFRTVGENIAMCPTLQGKGMFHVRIEGGVPHYINMKGNEIPLYSVEGFAKSVVDEWMNSPGHRANILNPEFEYLGCGCAGYKEHLGDTASIYYYYLTQNFGGGEIVRY